MTVQGISALIASLALLGVVVSLFLQGRQLKVLRLQTVRAMQFELDRIVMTDPSVYPSHLAEADPDTLRQNAFLQAWLKYVELGFQVGEFDEATVRSNARLIFGDRTYRDRWQQRQQQRTTPAANRKNRRFREILAEEARRQGPAPEPLNDPAPSVAGSSDAHGLTNQASALPPTP